MSLSASVGQSINHGASHSLAISPLVFAPLSNQAKSNIAKAGGAKSLQEQK